MTPITYTKLPGCASSLLSRRDTWATSSSDERMTLQASLLADDKVSQYRAFTDHLIARQQLRERMGSIITIDRADTPRSISSNTSLSS